MLEGHGGPETADYVSKNLPNMLLAHSPEEHGQLFEELDNAILEQFDKDHRPFRRKSRNWIHNAQLVTSGTTALVIDIDLQSLTATCSNAGDCRLLVFCLDGTKHRVVFQTEDLNVKTPSERERLVREHPNENHIFVGDRLFGRLMCTRGEPSSRLSFIQIDSEKWSGFGDGYYKLPRGLFGDARHRGYIDTISSIERKGKIPMNAQYASLFFGYKTPPYITARPETSSCQLQNGSIVILASDGLWDLISAEEAMRIVSLGIENREDNLAKYLLDNVIRQTPPGDDVTILIYRI